MWSLAVVTSGMEFTPIFSAALSVITAAVVALVVREWAR